LYITIIVVIFTAFFLHVLVYLEVVMFSVSGTNCSSACIRPLLGCETSCRQFFAIYLPDFFVEKKARNMTLN